MNGTAMACVSEIRLSFKDCIEGTEITGLCYLKQKQNSILQFYVGDMAWLTPDQMVYEFNEPDRNKPRGVWVEAWKAALKNTLEALDGSRWITGLRELQVFSGSLMETKAPSDVQVACKHVFKDWLGEKPPEPPELL